MALKDFCYSLLKSDEHRLPAWLSDLAASLYDVIIDSLINAIYEVSPVISYLYDEKKQGNTIQSHIDAAWKSFDELKTVMTEMAKTSEGEYVDVDDIDKKAEEEEWSEKEKNDYWADEIQMQIDMYTEDVKMEYGKDFWEYYSNDRSLEWRYEYEVPHILQRKEEELGEALDLNEDSFHDFLLDSFEYNNELDLDKPLKFQIIAHTFEIEE